jgi:hypothetical protein
VHGVAVRLDLTAALGKVSNLVNMRRLEFFELRDSVFGESDLPLEPLQAGDDVQRWEVRRILGHRLHKQREEMYVDWAGYDQSWALWVHRDSLLADVPALVAAYDATPSAFQARRAAPSGPPRVDNCRRSLLLRRCVPRLGCGGCTSRRRCGAWACCE